MMTENMKTFIEINKKFKIVEGLRVKSDGKEARTVDELNNSNIKYIFKGGRSIILTSTDLASNTNYLPMWDI